ncbi:unnamed protein product, partial [Owenia fusiformis]
LDNHLWLSIFSKPPESHFTRVQRTTCVFTLILSQMLTIVLFFGIPKDGPEDQKQYGRIHSSSSAIIIGLWCSLIMSPVILIIEQLFRQTKAKPRTTENKTDDDEIPEDLYSEEGYESMDTTRSDSTGSPEIADNLVISYDETEPLCKQNRMFFTPNQSTPNSSKLNVSWLTGPDHILANGSSPSMRPSKLNPCVGDTKTTTITTTISLHDRSGNVALETWKQQVDKELESGLGSEAFRHSVIELQVKKEQPVGLPWWFLFINWTLSILICLSASYFVILYGLKYSYQASMEWLTSILTSMLTSILIMQPLKVVALAILSASICKKKHQIQDSRDKIVP